MKIAIIGKGKVGSALCSGLSGKHETRFGHRDPAVIINLAYNYGTGTKIGYKLVKA